MFDLTAGKLLQYQATQSWTRGVELVLAGGVMGILAAINDEVERSPRPRAVLPARFGPACTSLTGGSGVERDQVVDRSTPS